MKRIGVTLVLAALCGLPFANADILPGNVMFNSDVEQASGDPAFPVDWFHAAAFTEWSTDQSVSPTHALRINDTDQQSNSDWRSHGVLVGANTRVKLRWHWLHFNLDGEFAVTIRFFDGVDDVGNTTGSFHGETNFFTGQGTLPEWEARQETIDVPGGSGSFDIVIRTLSGGGFGGTGATGDIFVDDISAAFPCHVADLDDDHDVDLSDLTGLLSAFGTIFSDPDYNVAADFDLDGQIGLSDLTVLLSAFGTICP